MLCMEVLAASAALFSIICVALLIIGRNSIQSPYVTLLFFVVSIYLLGNYFEIAHLNLEETKIGLFIRFIAVPFIPTLWYFCVRKYCGLSFKRKLHAALFLVVPTLFVLLCFTWESNHLYIKDIYYINETGHGNVSIEYGPLKIVRTLYQFGINILGIVTIYLYRIKGTKRFRRQASLFLVSMLIPLSNTTTYLITIDRYNIDITPYTLLLATTFTLMLYYVGYINVTDIIRNNTIDSILEGVLYFDKDGIYLGSNAAAGSIFPQLSSVCVGTNVDQMDFLPLNSLAAETPVSSKDVTEFSLKKNEGLQTYSLAKAQICQNNKIAGYSIIINDITQMKQLMNAMEEKSKRDPLTGLYNKGFLLDYGPMLLKEAMANHQSISLLMMDIDFFKKINDNYGHPYGDFVLKETAALCQKTFRKSDFVIRYGGEEFCILLLDMDYEAAKKKAEQLRNQIANHQFEQNGIAVRLTVSMGLASQGKDAPPLQMEELVQKADEKLYVSKQTGRNKLS